MAFLRLWIIGAVGAAGTGPLLAQGEAPATASSPEQIQAADSPQRSASRLAKLLEIPSERAAAVDKLLRLGPDAVPALITTLNDPRPEIVTIALATIASLGRVAQPALPSLERLARGKDKQIARAALWARHKMRPVGITLVAEYTAGKITRIDAAGKATPLGGLKGPFDVELLPNGNYLIVEYGKNRVREITPKGKCIWEYTELKQPIDADALANGNVLIVERSGKRVIEVTRKGKILWEYTHAGKAPQDAERLANGNTQIAYYDDGLLLEVDPNGKVVWKLTTLKMLSDADRLANGNILLTSSGAKIVREIDRTGKVVMEIQVGERASDADRLPNGHTLVATNTAVIEFDAKGKECWRHAAGYAGDANRY